MHEPGHTGGSDTAVKNPTSAQRTLAEDAESTRPTTQRTQHPIKWNKSEFRSAKVRQVTATTRPWMGAGGVRDGKFEYGNCSTLSSDGSVDTRILIRSHFNRWTIFEKKKLFSLSSLVSNTIFELKIFCVNNMKKMKRVSPLACEGDGELELLEPVVVEWNGSRANASEYSDFCEKKNANKKQNSPSQKFT